MGGMKKIINSPDNVVADSLKGLELAHLDTLRIDHENKVVYARRGAVKGKVGLVSGGGSGHEPLHSGFVGPGMLDAACCGEVFTSPVPDQMMAATSEVDGGAGVLHIVKNYTGDVMNFEMAAEMANAETGVDVRSVVVNDDVAVQDSLYTAGRRGVGATVFVEKLAGAAAEAKASLDEVERRPLVTADELAAELVEPILADLDFSGEPVFAMLNGMGATPMIELYLAYGEVAAILEAKGIKVARCLVGNYITSLDMAGCSLTLTQGSDELLKLWDAPVNTTGLRWGC